MRNHEMIDLVNFNGKILAPAQVPISFNNRAFKYGDSVFETIRANGHYPLAFHLHYKRMIKAMISLKMDISSIPKQDDLEKMIFKLLQKLNYYHASRVRIELFRSGDGLYTPETNVVDFLIEANSIDHPNYILNEKGLLLSVYGEMKKSYSPVSWFKNGNSMHYILAALNKKHDKVDDCLLINDNDKIIEAISSNLFWIKDKEVYTPSVFAGCVDGVMRQQIIQIIRSKTRFKLRETQGASEFDLLNADEVFLTNAIQGIRWVVGLKEKRYFNRHIRQLVELLNDTALV